MSQPSSPNEGGFVRGLGLLDSTMLVAGSMIGSGIFIVSSIIAPAGRLARLVAGGLDRHRPAHADWPRFLTASWRR